jgi:predicted nucleotidyltransferase component of viral defense system
MTKTLLDLESIIKEHQDKTDSYKRNLLKSYLQVFALRYLYAHQKYGSLVFYGGSALALCYDLPRLSEDLDFVDLTGKINTNDLAKDLGAYFNKELGFSAKPKIQKFRIYFKFPILKKLGLAQSSQSDLLYLKIEIFDGSDFSKKYATEIKPLFKFNQSVLVKTFDLPTLMATKIKAVLFRKWEKKDKSGKLLTGVKGRDYFDLMWYLEKGVVPNLDCLEGINSLADLKKRLLLAVEEINNKSVALDLDNFIADQDFAKNLGKNLKDILRAGINRL